MSEEQQAATTPEQPAAPAAAEQSAPAANADDFFSSENEVESGWFKFNKVGDRIKGTLVEFNRKPGTNGYPDQIVYQLTRTGGAISNGVAQSYDRDEIVNVALNINKKFVHDRLRTAKKGQIIGFQFEDEYQTDAAAKAGKAPSKTIKPFKGGLDQEWLNEQAAGGETVENVPF